MNDKGVCRTAPAAQGLLNNNDVISGSTRVLSIRAAYKRDWSEEQVGVNQLLSQRIRVRDV